MIKIEVNLDDTPGEWLGYTMELLFKKGAKDVFYTPIYMKKNRPGILLQLLCNTNKLNTMKQIIFRETTTLGIRYYPLTVHRLERRFYKINTKWGRINVKQGLKDGITLQNSPEFEECKMIAEKEKIPLKKVYEEIWEKIAEYNEGQ